MGVCVGGVILKECTCGYKGLCLFCTQVLSISSSPLLYHVEYKKAGWGQAQRIITDWKGFSRQTSHGVHLRRPGVMCFLGTYLKQFHSRPVRVLLSTTFHTEAHPQPGVTVEGPRSRAISQPTCGLTKPGILPVSHVHKLQLVKWFSNQRTFKLLH